MNQVTRVLLIRHGETVWNRAGRIQGGLDSELTSIGMAQAESVADRLRSLTFDALYSSDLRRAYVTAERISAVTGCAISVEPRLRERALGIFEGLNERELRERYPEEWNRFLSRDPDYRIPGGESSRDRVRRAKSVLDDVARLHAGGTVLLVTHGGILDAVFRLVTGVPLEAPRQFKIWNAGVNVISRPARGKGAPAGEPVSPERGDSHDTGGLANGGPASATGDGWMIELWGDTGALIEEETLGDT